MPPKTTHRARKAKKTAKASSTGRLGKVSTRSSKVKAHIGELFPLPSTQPTSGHHHTASSPYGLTDPTPWSSQELNNIRLAMLCDISEGPQRVSVI